MFIGAVEMKQDIPIQLIAAPFTPFDEKGEIRYDQIPAQARFLENRGVSGVFTGGTTGEGMSLTVEERKRLTLEWKSALGPNLAWFVHVGHACVKDAQELARHAEQMGAPAIASLGPTFFSATSPAALADYCRAIAEAAPHTPFYYYHMPAMARVEPCAAPAMRLMMERVPTFAGIKFTHENLEDYRACVELGGSRYTVLFGRDELLLSAVRLGARHAVGSTYNYAAPLYLEIARRAGAGDMMQAESLQALCTEAIRCAVVEGGLPAIKVIHGLAGLEVGPVRSPLETLSAAAVKRLRASLQEIDFFGEIERRLAT